MPEGRTFPTSIDISEEARSQLIDMLNHELADTYDLYTQCKFAHWNVKGADFSQLHELFDQLAGHLLDLSDSIAERATALGGTALGTARMAAKASRIPEYPEKAVAGEEALAALVERFAAYAASVRKALARAEELDDMATNDLLIDVSRQVDKDLWLLEAHLQDR